MADMACSGQSGVVWLADMACSGQSGRGAAGGAPQAAAAGGGSAVPRRGRVLVPQGARGDRRRAAHDLIG
eukprot:2118255-Pyramimonas_sp.AAC.1